ncbi:hypothetical protein V502_00170 [Pseudogymnoascus sp. VKM F-4520 (FW-2644)]|nr:hypothetical protein V502_00170 [Pseudogymnoascus sp. VKM F-4520 (FW-2644)]
MTSNIEECYNGSREIKLISAFASNKYKEVENLLQAGVDVNEKNALGETPLHWAACVGNLYYISKLMSMGADIGATTLAGKTALHNAAQFGQAEALLLLLDGGADMQATDLKGRTVLHTAIEEGGDNYETVSLLIERGADDLAEYTHKSKQHNIATLLKLKRPLLSSLPKKSAQE